MEKRILNSNFKHIKTVVCYKAKMVENNLRFKFIPDESIILNDQDIKIDIENHVYNNVMYLGNNNILDNNDFVQYDFSYAVSKNKYNSELVINKLNQESKNFLPIDSDLLTQLEEVIFPSNTEDNSEDNIRFFGSMTVNSGKFFSLSIDELVYKVELYEDVIYSNQSSHSDFAFIEYGIQDIVYTNKPSMIVTFGPSDKILNNPGEWYYKKPVPDNRAEVSDIEYEKSIEEILSSKSLNFYFPKIEGNITIPVLNLTLESWSADNKNPNRNSYKHLLRNDEFFELMKKVNPVKITNGNYQYDTSSMTLLSSDPTIPQEDLPILKSKLRWVEDKKWKSYVRYNKGDFVYCGEDSEGEQIKWISLVDNNVGNYPILSSDWEKEGELRNYYSHYITVNSYGIVKPDNYIILNRYTNYTELNIIPPIGYDFNLDIIKVRDSGGNMKDDLRKDYKDYDHYVSQDLGHILVFKGDQITKLVSNDIDNIYINTIPVEYLINFDIIGSPIELNIEGLVDGKAKINDILVISSDDELYNINIITNTGEIIEPNEEGKVILKVSPTQDNDHSGSITYLINTIPTGRENHYTVSVIEFNGFIVENPEQIFYNETYSIRFYPENNSDNNFTISINGTEYNINGTEYNNELFKYDSTTGIYCLTGTNTDFSEEIIKITIRKNDSR